MPDPSASGIAAAGGPLKQVPPAGTADYRELRQVIDQRIPYNSVVRVHEVSRHRRAELYDGNQQWINSWYSDMDAFAPSQWREMEQVDADPYVIPTPVLNEGFAPRCNETARLGRPEYEPDIPTKGTNPDFRTRRGARKAKNILKFELARNRNGDVMQAFCYHLPLYGVAYLASEWEETWDNVGWVPHTDSLACPRHPLLPGNRIQETQQVGPDIQVPSGGGVTVKPADTGDKSGPSAETVPDAVATQPQPWSPQWAAGRSPAELAQASGDFSPEEGALIQATIAREQSERVAAGEPPTPPGSCYFLSAKKTVSRDELNRRGDLKPHVQDDGSDHFMPKRCPECADHPELVPFQAKLEEVKGIPPSAQNPQAVPPLIDSFGRRMGQLRPLGQWKIRNASPYDVYVENLGIDVDPGQLREWVEVHVESMKWCAERYPHLMRDKNGNPNIKPESPAQLSMYHPIAGSPTIFATGSDSKLFQDHSRVKDLVQKPTMAWDKVEKVYRWNRGRFIRMIGDVVCADTDYLIPSINRPGEFVERVVLEMLFWEPRDGMRRAAGLGMWDFMFDAQDMRNEIASQRSCVRQRMAVPMYVERRGYNIDSESFRMGMAGAWVVIDTDPLYPAGSPEVFNNMTIDPGVEAESQDMMAFIPRVTNFTEVERGDVPPGVSAATTVALLKDEAGESRRPRILKIKLALARLWSHGLRLIEALWIEPRPYRFERPDGELLWDTLHGLDLEGQTDVEIAPEPAFDSEDAEREGIRDLINLKVINPASDPRTNRIISEKLGAPDELFADYDNQEGQAQREWYQYLEKGEVPEVDPSLDNHTFHYAEHLRQCFSDDFRDLEAKAKWDVALAFLAASWDDSLAALIAPPPPQPVPGQAPPAMAPAPAPPPQAMVQQPPTPDSLQAKILEGWMQILQPVHPNLQPGADPDDQKALMMVLVWRAHAEAHNLLDQKRKQGQAPPMQQAA